MISVIIPVYNEERTIRKVLDTLLPNDNLEVIVVDGKSQDRTVEFAKGYPVRVIQTVNNRAVQMNKGAEKARGEVLLFLHADCLLEEQSFEAIQGHLRNGCVGGCLLQRINSNRSIYRFIEASGNIRAKLFKIFYGDQAIFVRRDVFGQIGGFDNVKLFEDVLFSKKLKSAGKTLVLNKRVYVSSRRWKRQGIFKATLINWLVTLGFSLRVPTEKIRNIYDDIR